MWRRFRSLAAAGTALVLAGSGLAIASTFDWGGPALRADGPERPVNEGAGDLADISAHNSPTIARNPRDAANLAVSSRIDTPRFSCALHVSFDGGARWRQVGVPIPPGEQPKCYAPDVAYAADGTLHVSFVTLRGTGNVPHAVWVTSSRDGGRSVGSPVRVSGPRAFQVRVTTDPADARRVHLTWLQARELGPLRFTEPGNPIVTARSDDGGTTWQRPVPVTGPDRSRVLAPTPAVGVAGELYVLFLDVGEDRLDYEGGHDGFGGPPYAGRFELVLARSRDGGAPWEETVADAAIQPIERFVAFLPPFPALAIDRRDGTVYAGFHDRRGGSADVWVRALERDASGWRQATPVNDAAEGDGTSQYLPQLSVAPDGRLDVVYYDRRADRANARNDVSFQSSSDGGRTFTPRVRLSSRAFDARIGFGSERGMPDLGSRLGLVSDADGALAVWTDTRHGTDASNKQDLYAARIDGSGSDGELEGTARDAGLALAVGGVVALGLAALRRRSAQDQA